MLSGGALPPAIPLDDDAAGVGGRGCASDPGRKPGRLSRRLGAWGRPILGVTYAALVGGAVVWSYLAGAPFLSSDLQLEEELV